MTRKQLAFIDLIDHSLPSFINAHYIATLLVIQLYRASGHVTDISALTDRDLTGPASVTR